MKLSIKSYVDTRIPVEVKTMETIDPADVMAVYERIKKYNGNPELAWQTNDKEKTAQENYGKDIYVQVAESAQAIYDAIDKIMNSGEVPTKKALLLDQVKALDIRMKGMNLTTLLDDVIKAFDDNPDASTTWVTYRDYFKNL